MTDEERDLYEDEMIDYWFKRWLCLIVMNSCVFVPIIFILEIIDVFDIKCQIILTIVYLLSIIVLAFVELRHDKRVFKEHIKRMERLKND
jgi:ABC-type uncharacterized transport system permease subunit